MSRAREGIAFPEHRRREGLKSHRSATGGAPAILSSPFRDGRSASSWYIVDEYSPIAAIEPTSPVFGDRRAETNRVCVTRDESSRWASRTSSRLRSIHISRFSSLGVTGYNPIPMLLLQLAVVLYELPWIMADGIRYLMAYFTNVIYCRIGFHDVSPSSSSGVTRAGTNRPSSALTRRIWPNLFAFAKWRQLPAGTSWTSIALSVRFSRPLLCSTIGELKRTASV